MPPLMSANDRLRRTNPGSCMTIFLKSTFNVKSMFNSRLFVLLEGELFVEDGDATVELLTAVTLTLSWYTRRSACLP